MKPIIRKILCILLASAVLCLAVKKMLAMFIERKTDLVETVTASHDISPRTEITADDLTVIQVPRAYLLNNTFTEAEDVIGMYTEIGTVIPAGSPFYKSLLKEESELPDHASLQLEEGQAVYTMTPDLSDLSVLCAGQRVDLHVSLQKADGTPMSGCLFEHVRIISLEDHQGNEITDEGSGTPYLITLAIDKEDIDLLTLAETAGEVRLFSTSSSSTEEDEAVLCTEDPIYAYLVSLSEENAVATVNGTDA